MKQMYYQAFELNVVGITRANVDPAGLSLIPTNESAIGCGWKASTPKLRIRNVVGE